MDSSRAAHTAGPSIAPEKLGLDPWQRLGLDPDRNPSMLRVPLPDGGSEQEVPSVAGDGGWGWYEAGELPALLAWLEGGSAQEQELADAVFEAARPLLPDTPAAVTPEVRAGVMHANWRLTAKRGIFFPCVRCEGLIPSDDLLATMLEARPISMVENPLSALCHPLSTQALQLA